MTMIKVNYLEKNLEFTKVSNAHVLIKHLSLNKNIGLVKHKIMFVLSSKGACYIAQPTS